jgi:hypothetical protein
MIESDLLTIQQEKERERKMMEDLTDKARIDIGATIKTSNLNRFVQLKRPSRNHKTSLFVTNSCF